MENKIPFILLSSKVVFHDPEIRLNASSYPIEWVKATKILDKVKEKFVVEKISTFAEKIFVGARVKRLFVNEKEGIPYLMPDDVFTFPLKVRKWVRKETQDIENWWVKPFDILITQSGAAGRCLIVNKYFKGKLVSPNMIRVVPNNKGKEIVGFIYTYLNTTFGQSFLLKQQYGITVKHVEPQHVAEIPIPLLPESDIKEINEKILNAQKLIEEAQGLLIDAEKLFYEELNLPILNEEDINYMGNKGQRPARAFTLKSQQTFLKDFRLNAFSYMPICLYAESFLRKGEHEGRFELKKLKDISKEIFTPPRFKRLYVKNRSEGVPLLQGSHIPMVKYFDLKYVSKKMENLNEYIIKENWILVTCSGTVGRVFLTTKFCDRWAATNHMTRIIPLNEINVGYLTCFLQSVYGSSQLQTLMYGGVVEEIGEAGELIGEILVPIPSLSIQEKIGKLVVEAYEKKDQANLIEDEAVKLLEKKLEEMAK